MQNKPISNISFTDRLSVSGQLTATHIVAMLVYILISIVVMVIFSTSSNLTTILIGFVISFAIFWIGVLAAFIYTMSHSKYFAIRISILDSLSIAFKLEIQLFLIWIVIAFILNFILGSTDSFGVIIIIIILYLFSITVFPLLSFYFIVTWILDNNDNHYLKGTPNHKYRYNVIQNPNPQFEPPFQQVQPMRQINTIKPSQRYCGKCGVILKEESGPFCPKCGTQI